MDLLRFEREVLIDAAVSRYGNHRFLRAELFVLRGDLVGAGRQFQLVSASLCRNRVERMLEHADESVHPVVHVAPYGKEDLFLGERFGGLYALGSLTFIEGSIDLGP